MDRTYLDPANPINRGDRWVRYRGHVIGPCREQPRGDLRQWLVLRWCSITRRWRIVAALTAVIGLESAVLTALLTETIDAGGAPDTDTDHFWE